MVGTHGSRNAKPSDTTSVSEMASTGDVDGSTDGATDGDTDSAAGI